MKHKLKRFASLYENEKTEYGTDLTPLGTSAFASDESKNYFINDGEKCYALEILRDLETFKLFLPDYDGNFIIGTTKDLVVNNLYYRLLIPGDALFNWINHCMKIPGDQLLGSGELSEFRSRFNEQNETNPKQSTKIKFGPPVSYLYTLELPNGIYNLEVLGDFTTFKLTIPMQDETIVGSDKDLKTNSKYWKSLAPDDTIFNWIRYCLNYFRNEQSKTESLDEKINMFKSDSFFYDTLSVNDNEYTVAYNPLLREGSLYIPSRMVNFTDDIYEALPELPTLEGGSLNVKLRECLKEAGAKLPETPYEMAFRVTDKKT